MEQLILILLAGFSIQGLIAAPSTASPKPSAVYPYPPNNDGVKKTTEMTSTPSKDAEIYQEFQHLKDSAEQFRQQILKFTTALSTQLNPGSPLRGLIDQVVDSITTQTMDYIKQVEQSGNAFLSRATKATGERLRRGKEVLDSKFASAHSTIEDLQWKSEQLFQNGIAYLRYIEQNLMTKLMANVRLSLTADNQKAGPQPTDGNQHLQRRDGTPTGSDAGLTSVVTQQYHGIQDSGVGVMKGLTILSTGSIIGILDALSAVLTTTTDVGLHAKRALSDINKSGAHAVNSVIGTAGSFVSGTLDRTGEVVEALRFGPQQQGGAESSEAPTNHAQRSTLTSGNSVEPESSSGQSTDTIPSGVNNTPREVDTPKENVDNNNNNNGETLNQGTELKGTENGDNTADNSNADNNPPPAAESIAVNNPPPAAESIAVNNPPPAAESIAVNNPPPAAESITDNNINISNPANGADSPTVSQEPTV